MTVIAPQDYDQLAGVLLAAALDAVIVMNDQGLVVEFNPMAESLFGYTRAEAVGRPLKDLIVPPDMRDRHEAGYRRYVATGESRIVGRRIEIEAMRSDGALFPVEMTMIEARLGGQRLFAAHLRDLTEKRRLEAEATAQRERLLGLEKLSALGTLLSGVAHELNNPLAIILAQSTLLKEKAKEADVLRRAERIHGASERCARIVKSFMAMARQKPQRRTLHDINDIVRDSLELTGYGRRSAGIETRVTLRDNLPSVCTDRDLVSQALSHVLVFAQSRVMARDADRAIGIATQEREGFVMIEVTDNGPDIPEHLVARLFDPYAPVNPTGAGTGIGLHVAHDTAVAHGGRLVHEHRPDGGALFRMFIPTAVAELAAPAGLALPAGQGPRVLIVDDEIDVGRSLGDLLSELGCPNEVVDNPDQALRRLREHRFSAIISDYRMPAMDGRSLLRQVVTNHPDMAGRCVLATGDVVGAEQAQEIRFLLPKPFTLQDVRHLVAQLGLGT